MQGNPGCFSKTRLFDNLPNNRSNVAIGDKSLNIKPNSRPSLDECFGRVTHPDGLKVESLVPVGWSATLPLRARTANDG